MGCCACRLRRWCADVHGCSRLRVVVVTQLDTHLGQASRTPLLLALGLAGDLGGLRFLQLRGLLAAVRLVVIGCCRPVVSGFGRPRDGPGACRQIRNLLIRSSM